MSQTESAHNTFIRPYHAFCRENAWYVVNRDRFAFECVPRAFVTFLDTLEREPATRVSEEDRKRLLRLKLLNPRSSEGPKPSTGPQADQEPPVEFATIFVTQQCNHRCVYCYGGGGEYGDPCIMDEETGIQAVEWLWGQKGSLKSVGISFFGGEPLLNFSLVQKMVAHAHTLEKGFDARFRFTLATNAALLDDHVLAFMQAHDFYALVGFDGPKEIQDRNRPLRNGESSYDTVVPRIQKLIAARPEQVTLRATIWQKGDIPKVVREMRALDPFLYQTPLASPGGRLGQGAPEPTADWLDQVEALSQAIPEFLAALRKKDAQTLSSLNRWIGFKSLLSAIGRHFRRSGTCGVGRGLVAVSSRGTIYPCHRFVGHDRYAIGNIHTGELNRGIYLNPPLLTSPQCNSCWAKHVCDGGCIHDHLARTGHRFTPSEGYCEMKRSLFEISIHLASQLTREEKEFMYEKELVMRPFCPLDLG